MLQTRYLSFNWKKFVPGSIHVFLILIIVICLIVILAIRPRVIKNVKKTMDEISKVESDD